MEDPLAAWDTVQDRVVVGPHHLRLRRPRSAEELIDEDDYARDERLPYWAELWPSAHVLARVLAGRDLAGRPVLELGCGVGLPSIVAALGGARVLATDWYADALAFAAANAAAAGATVETLVVDWASPPPELAARGPARLVVGADLLYEERNGDLLAALLPALVAPGGEVLIADPRRPHADRLLEPLAAAGWSHRREDLRHAGRPDESGPVIHLHHLVAPDG